MALTTALWASSFVSDRLRNEQTFSDRVDGEIFAGITAGQTFTAAHNGLNGVEVHFHTFDRRNECRLIFRLFDMRTAAELVTVEVPAAELVNDEYYRVSFPTILESKGHVYLFTLESPDGEIWRAVGVWGSNADRYRPGARFVNMEPRDDDLAFKTTYRLTLPMLLDTYLDLLTENKPGFLGNNQVLLLLFATHVLLSGAILVALVRSRG